MEHFFAIVKKNTPIIDPRNGQVAGHNQEDVRKAFDLEADLIEVRDWARAQGAHGVTLMFETPREVQS